MIFLALLMVGVLVVFGLIFFGTTNPGFTSYYDSFFKRIPFVTTEVDGKTEYGEFWVDISRWLGIVAIVAAVLLVVVIILSLKKMIDPYLSQLPIYICMLCSMGLYYFTCIKLARYDFEMSGHHKAYFLFCIICCFMAIACLIARFVTLKKNAKTDHHSLFSKMRIIVPVAIVAVMGMTLFFWFKAYSLCRDYEMNYGLFGKSGRTKLEIENEFMGNYVNQAVDTEEGLFYIDWAVKDGRPLTDKLRVMKMDKNGDAEEIYSGADYEGNIMNLEFYNIGYADGYLYMSRPSEVIRMDPSDGSQESVIFPEEGCIIDQCVVLDNKIYCLEVCADKAPFILVSEIHGTDISKAEIYAEDLVLPSSRNGSELLINYIAGEDPTNTRSKYSYQVYDGKAMYLEEYLDPDCLLDVDYLLMDDDNIKYAGAANVYQGKIYYVLFAEDGFNVCTYDLETLEKETIGFCDNGRDTRNIPPYSYKIMIGQGKVFVTAYSWSYQEIDDEGDLEYFDEEVLYYIDIPC